MENMETIVMELVVHAGNGRSLAIQAIREARAGRFEDALQLLEQCSEELLCCHCAQTDLIQAEVQGQSVPLSLLMVHAQDHIMNAITVRDLAVEIIAILKNRR